MAVATGDTLAKRGRAGAAKAPPDTCGKAVARVAEPADAAVLRATCLGDCSEDELRAQIEDSLIAYAERRGVQLVAVLGSEVAGTLRLVRHPQRWATHRATIVAFAVESAGRAVDVASTLVEALRTRAAALGIRLLEVRCAGGTPADYLLRRVGFQEYCRLRGGVALPDGRAQARVDRGRRADACAAPPGE